jgi:hypothetical protein
MDHDFPFFGWHARSRAWEVDKKLLIVTRQRAADAALINYASP